MEISSQLGAWQQSCIDKMVQAMGLLGAKCVNHARKIPKDIGFEDQTGNLRSSIGFKIFVGGNPVREDYRKVKDGEKGMENGKALADDVGQECGSRQIMLVVTAGMEYAVHVESLGRDVIASSEQMAGRLFPEYMKRVENMVKRQAGMVGE
jgi:hypothetical protein